MLQVAITSCDSYGLDDMAQHTPAAATTATAPALAPAPMRTAHTKLAPVAAGQQSSSNTGLGGSPASRDGRTVDVAAITAVNAAGAQQERMASPRREVAATASILPPVVAAAGPASAAAGVSSFDQRVTLDSPPSHRERWLMPGDKDSQLQLRPSDLLAGRQEVEQQQGQQQYGKILQQQQQQRVGKNPLLPVQTVLNDSDEELMDLILEEPLVL
jgi:hypothetical protein